MIFTQQTNKRELSHESSLWFTDTAMRKSLHGDGGWTRVVSCCWKSRSPLGEASSDTPGQRDARFNEPDRTFLFGPFRSIPARQLLLRDGASISPLDHVP